MNPATRDSHGQHHLCPNCGHKVDFHFCANCGQSLREIRTSIWHLVMELIGELFAFDSKLFRSIKLIYLKPGLLTLAFIDGKRRSYIPPIRMCLFISVFFFLTINLVNEIDFNHKGRTLVDDHLYNVLTEAEIDPEIRRPAAAAWKERKVAHFRKRTIRRWHENQTDDPTLPDIPVDQLIQCHEEGTNLPTCFPSLELSDHTTQELKKLKKYYGEKVKKIEVKYESYLQAIDKGAPIEMKGSFTITDENWFYDIFKKTITERIKYISNLDPNVRNQMAMDSFLKSISKILFLLLPIFALFLKLIYIRKNPLYIDHLVFALHYHSFLFGFYSLLIWINVLAPWEDVFVPITILIMLIVSPAYLWLALKRVHGQGFLKTTLKLALLLLFYVPSLILLIALAAIFTVFAI